MVRPQLILLVPVVALMALAAGGCARPEAAAAASAGELTVTRGDLATTLLLTGELVAARADVIEPPRTSAWRVTVRWLAEDGTVVRPGDPVAELDGGEAATNLEDLRLAAAEKAEELSRRRAEIELTAADKELAVATAQAELGKAKLRADVPPELLPAREVEERRLALRKAEAGLAKAQEDLDAERKAGESDLEMARLELERARREAADAEGALAALRLVAPSGGLLVLGQHPWEGRKVEVGDSVWPGFNLASLPDLTSLEVSAVLFDVDDGRVTPGMQAACTFDAAPGERVEGRVQEVAAVAAEVERSTLRRVFRVRIALDRVAPEWMRPGMSVKAAVTTATARETLVAPRQALDLAADPPRAALAEGGWATVRVGPCNATHCAIEDGLDSGVRLAPASRPADPAAVAEAAG